MGMWGRALGGGCAGTHQQRRRRPLCEGEELHEKAYLLVLVLKRDAAQLFEYGGSR